MAHFSFGASHFRERLKAELKAQGWKQTDFAAAVERETGCKMSQSRVSQFTKGKADPSLDEVQALAYTLGITPEWLAWERGVKKAAKPPVHHDEPESELIYVPPKRRRGGN